jgi:hypothetical protein
MHQVHMGRLPFIAIHFRQQVVINVVFHHSPALRVPEGEVDLGGLTMSLEGGWEELDVFLESLATCSESVFIFARNSAICDSSMAIRASYLANWTFREDLTSP